MDIEYKNIEDLYKKVANLSCQNFTLSNIRNNFDKKVLKSYYNVGNLTTAEMQAIQAKTANVKLSADTMIKNMINHCELTIDDYKNIRKYIENADFILKSSNKNLIYFKINNAIYQIVIKTTKDKQENFLTTFHKSSKQQLKKDMERYMQIKR